MWRRLCSPYLERQIGRGAALLRDTPGSRGLLSGALATGLILLVLHPQGLAAGVLRVVLAVPVIVLFLATSGELARLRHDARRMSALVRTSLPRRGALSRRRSLLLAALWCVLGVSRRPLDTRSAADVPARQESGLRPREMQGCTRGRATRCRAGRVPHAGHAPHTTRRTRRGKGGDDESRRR